MRASGQQKAEPCHYAGRSRLQCALTDAEGAGIQMQAVPVGSEVQDGIFDGQILAVGLLVAFPGITGR